eukprot:UN30329
MENLVDEMKALKQLIIDNANSPAHLCRIIRKETFNFDNKGSGMNEPESMRRICWLVDKYLTVRELHNFKLAPVTLAMFEDLSEYFLQTNRGRGIQEYADILWTLATFGCRPAKLCIRIIKHMDKMWDQCKPNELADFVFACGELQISSVPLIFVLDDFVRKNDEEHTLHRFLPRDLPQMAYGYAMMDPVYHNYKFVWILNSHLCKLAGNVDWQSKELLQIY